MTSALASSSSARAPGSPGAAKRASVKGRRRPGPRPTLRVARPTPTLRLVGGLAPGTARPTSRRVAPARTTNQAGPGLAERGHAAAAPIGRATANATLRRAAKGALRATCSAPIRRGAFGGPVISGRATSSGSWAPTTLRQAEGVVGALHTFRRCGPAALDLGGDARMA